MRLVLIVAVLWSLGVPFAGQVAAQTRPRPAVDVSAGWAWFADESLIDVEHGYVGGSPRFYLTRGVSVGPEVVHMVGPGTDRDLFVTANINYEWPLPVSAASPRLTPFVLAGWGYMRHTPRFGTRIGHGQAVVGGGGVRVRITDRVSAGAEFRMGLELHLRVGAIASIRLGP
jgi:hypothetical protein